MDYGKLAFDKVQELEYRLESSKKSQVKSYVIPLNRSYAYTHSLKLGHILGKDVGIFLDIRFSSANNERVEFSLKNKGAILSKINIDTTSHENTQVHLFALCQEGSISLDCSSVGVEVSTVQAFLLSGDIIFNRGVFSFANNGKDCSIILSSQNGLVKYDFNSDDVNFNNYSLFEFSPCAQLVFMNSSLSLVYCDTLYNVWLYNFTSKNTKLLLSNYSIDSMSCLYDDKLYISFVSDNNLYTFTVSDFITSPRLVLENVSGVCYVSGEKGKMVIEREGKCFIYSPISTYNHTSVVKRGLNVII